VKKIAKEYKKLSSEERQIFDNMAAEDKLRYKNEIKNYKSLS